MKVLSFKSLNNLSCFESSIALWLSMLRHLNFRIIFMNNIDRLFANLLLLHFHDNCGFLMSLCILRFCNAELLYLLECFLDFLYHKTCFHFDGKALMVRYTSLCWNSFKSIAFGSASGTENKHVFGLIVDQRSWSVVFVTGIFLNFASSKRDRNRSRYWTLLGDHLRNQQYHLNSGRFQNS